MIETLTPLHPYTRSQQKIWVRKSSVDFTTITHYPLPSTIAHQPLGFDFR